MLDFKKGLKKVLMIGAVLVAGLSFESRVLAAGPTYEYQLYENGEHVYYNEEIMSVCNGLWGACADYTVSEDDGAEDDSVLLTKVSDSTQINVYKSQLVAGYVLHSTKEMDIDFSNPEYPPLATGADSVTYFKPNANLKSIIANASKYDNIYYVNGNLSTNMDFETVTIPKDVTVTTPGAYFDELTVNGKLKVGYLHVNEKLFGTGTVELDYNYREYEGDDEESDDINVEDACRLMVERGIYGTKIKIINAELKDGMQLGHFGESDRVTEEDAKAMLEALNKTLDSSLEDYEVVLATYKFIPVEETKERIGYYGKLQKKKVAAAVVETKEEVKEEVKEEAKEEAKNPKTGIDNSYIFILGFLGVIGFGFGAKKFVKNN